MCRACERLTLTNIILCVRVSCVHLIKSKWMHFNLKWKILITKKKNIGKKKNDKWKKKKNVDRLGIRNVYHRMLCSKNEMLVNVYRHYRCLCCLHWKCVLRTHVVYVEMFENFSAFFYTIHCVTLISIAICKKCSEPNHVKIKGKNDDEFLH